MNQSEIIWVAGHSSVGKRHFIETSMKDPQTWAMKLGLGTVSRPEWLGDRPIDEIERLAHSHDCVLIHWQSRGYLKVYDLIDRLPRARHIVIHVSREIEDHRLAFESDYPGQQFDHGQHLNVTRTEEYRKVVDIFIDVANIAGVFHVVGRTATPYAR